MTTPALTLDEVEERVTTLYYLQRVNFEEADRIMREALPLWKRLPKNHRLRDVAERSPRSTTTTNLYNRQWVTSALHSTETAFTMTALLYALLNTPDDWPIFAYGDEDKRPHIETWTELIGMSEEAHSLLKPIQSTGAELTTLLINPEYGHEAQDLRGWYAKVWTSRRSVTGWITGGRGQTLHVTPDPLFNVRRQSLNYHSRPVSDKAAAKAASAVAINNASSGITLWGEAPEKYSLKSATIQMMLPPEMAMERKTWVTNLVAKAESVRADATPVREAYLKWFADTEEIRKARTKLREFERGLSTNIRKDWVEEQHSQLRWVNGAKEAVTYILKTISEDDLRAAIVEEWLSTHPLSRLTEPEITMLDNPPPGADSLDTTMADLIVAKHTGLAPLF